MSPLVSIITPCYNAAVFISQTIESVLAQSFDNWEMIIVDDCSSDDSLLIIQKYAGEDSRIRYLRTNKPSGSPSLPRNIGIREAKGQYIAFLDSDDVWLPGKLEEQLRGFKELDVAIVFSNYEKIGQEGERCGRKIIAPSLVDYDLLLKGNCIGCLTAMYDTEKVHKVFFKEIGHEDYVLWLYILKKGYKARNTNTVTALYRVSRQSVSSNKLRTILWQWNILKHEEGLSTYKAVYFFIHYAVSAFKKILI